MRNKILLLASACLFVATLQAQVGINTEKPTSTLDVNGTMHVANGIVLGGDDITQGIQGTEGQIIVSQGNNLPPVWRNITTPIPENGDYFLRSSIARTDLTGGIQLNYTTSDRARRYVSGELISPGWKEFEDFKVEIPASAKPVRVVLNFQSAMQINWENPTSDSWISFAVGVFLDNPKTGETTLQAVRTGNCSGVSYPQQLFTMTVTLDNLPVDQINTLRVFGIRRNQGSNMTDPNQYYIVMGNDLPGSPVDNSLLKRASLRVDIFEKVK